VRLAGEKRPRKPSLVLPLALRERQRAARCRICKRSSAEQVVGARAVVGGALLVGAACGGEVETAAPPAAVYVASTNYGDAGVSIAVVVDGRRVAAYACGDDPARERYPGWFFGAASNDGDTTLAREGWSFRAAFTDDEAEGTLVDPGGSRVRWV